MAGLARPLSWGDLLAFQAQCEVLGIDTPRPIVRALELVEVVRAHATSTTRSQFLEMSDDEARDAVTDISIRAHVDHQNSVGFSLGGIRFQDQLLLETRAAMLPLLDPLVESLQAEFARLAAPIVDGVQRYGFNGFTTAATILDLADDKAAAAFRAVKAAWSAIGPIVSFRISVSQVFGVSPTHAEQGVEYGGDGADLVDFTVCFAEGDTWSTDGFSYINGTSRSSIDWYKLAAGGLRLNTPSDVREKIVARERFIRHATPMDGSNEFDAAVQDALATDADFIAKVAELDSARAALADVKNDD
ncbi:hypothetical protein [Microbacterium sp.]|uniref:hypothetical protein n=1 Tax=Microbacterium sp. TaxID=51671 RepID=UPI003F702740